MSRFRDYNPGGIEMNNFTTTADSDPIYYNSISGQRAAISPSTSDYELVPDSYEADLSQESNNNYVNTMFRQPGDKPTFESLGYEYEDTLTIRKPPQQTSSVPTRAPADKYHDYEDNLLANARDQCRREGFDYEDVPDPVRYRSPIPSVLSKAQVQEEPVQPTRKEVKSKEKKRYGTCCMRTLLLWSVFLLMLVIAASIFLGLQQARMNELEKQCNMSVPFTFLTS